MMNVTGGFVRADPDDSDWQAQWDWFLKERQWYIKLSLKKKKKGNVIGLAFLKYGLAS